ncbi:YybH family protein [Actinomadura chibensis]|uniref:Nuclear transport factor 2 family protein n=1 Tax=Actinomadura chibensis TaxID=392828 RepID=A0A5D0NQE4_9ACTN|nr:nuclear transport factor 2 family protein [Actinomadura chibensis]TYB46348.1 nuclear transport factor 2 family protein [Actinomadura chibensis]
MSDTPSVRRTAPQADIDRILHLHREWWQANLDWDIPRMRRVFPEPGDEYLMFNFNGHPYFGMKEKVALWEFYKDLGSQSGIETTIMRLEIKGDMAWLACEFTLASEMADGGEWTADAVDAPAGRATEVYQRDDGSGGAEWRMWHTHITALPDLAEERPGLGGSTNGRGLGAVPWTPLPEGVGE